MATPTHERPSPLTPAYQAYHLVLRLQKVNVERSRAQPGKQGRQTRALSTPRAWVSNSALTGRRTCRAAGALSSLACDIMTLSMCLKLRRTGNGTYVVGAQQLSQCVRFRMAPAAFTSGSLIEGYKRYASIRADCGPAAAALVHTQIVSGCSGLWATIFHGAHQQTPWLVHKLP
mgnify:CR=1 FL=1